MPILIDFRAIRPHSNSQNRGFEELCWELMPVLAPLPAGVHVVRHGAPDGGVEMRATLPDGSVRAWQAKYLFALGDGEYAQLDRSVREALDSQPQLVRYTFCLPYDRPAANVKGRKSAMQKWGEHCAKWRGWAEAKGAPVEFHYIGESQLLSALLTPGQEGRARYWFDATILSPEWFRRHIDLALKDEGPRYTPELNVSLPIAAVFDGLGRTPRFQSQLRATLREIREARGRVELLRRIPEDAHLAASLVACAARLDELDRRILDIDLAASTAINFAGVADACVAALECAQQACDAATQKAHEAVTRAEPESGPGTPNEQFPQHREAEAWDGHAWSLRRLMSPVRDLLEMVTSAAARLVNQPALLVLGRPGAGKTHLLCDISQSREAALRPTVFLSGRTFTRDEPWSQILKQLHLDCGAEEFLAALDTAAEAQNTRALFIIDAINEGEGLELWPNYLAQFVAKVLSWPRLGIVLSCRTTYAARLVPESLDDTQLIRVTHHGFAGEEYQAVKEFFRYYELRLPDFPLLVPEFQNPLFLKLMCRTLHDRGETTMPRGTTGVTALFDAFLSGVNGRLAERRFCDFAVEERLVWQAVDALAREMLDTQQDHVPWARAKALLDDLLPRRAWSASLLHGLLREGVLMQDRLGRDGEEAADIVLFAYQRLGDHRRVAIFCEECATVELLTERLAALLSDHSAPYRIGGLLEALAIQLPERFQRELHDLVPDPLHDQIQDAYLESLIWRRTSAFPPDFPNAYLQGIAERGWGWRQVLDVFLHVACLPDHPLNARWLYRVLHRFSMAERDRWWSIEYLHWASYEESSPAMRLLHWARYEDTASCADDAVLLAGTTLAWYLTSPNRALRDEATKALVRLLRGRYRVLMRVLKLFQGVNDPYVAERVYAVAYGCCLVDTDREGIGQTATWIYHSVFEQQMPPTHLLLRDYARGIIERALDLGCALLDVDVTHIRPPYRSPWPLHAPTERALRDRHGADKAYWTPWFSVMNWDFRRYVLDGAVRHFLAPNQRKRMAALRQQAQAEAEDAATRFVEMLDAKQLVFLLSLDEPEAAQALRETLSEEQQAAIRYVLVQANQRRRLAEPIRFDSDFAARWVLSRVFALGWTPEFFEEYDRSVNREGGRGIHSRERVGKKYQWIALQELLAHIADHCKMQEQWGWQAEDPRWCNGPWELLRRDIDPSLQQRDTGVGMTVTPTSWWVPAGPQFPPLFDNPKRNTWIETDVDLPDPTGWLCVQDVNGASWLILAGSAEWRAELPPEVVDRFAAGQCVLWYQVHSYLIHRQDRDAFVPWLAAVDDLYHSALPESESFSEAFLGEYPWHPASAPMRAEWVEPSEHEAPVRVGSTTASYSCTEGGYDASVGDGVRGELPSSLLVEGMGLHWQGQGLRYRDIEGTLVAWDPSAECPGPSALLVQWEPFLRYLDEHQLTVVWTVVGEKQAFGSTAAHGLDGLREIRGFYSLLDGKLHKELFVSKLRHLKG